MVKWSCLPHAFPLILLERLNYRATGEPFAGGISECGGFVCIRYHFRCPIFPYIPCEIKDISHSM